MLARGKHAGDSSAKRSYAAKINKTKKTMKTSKTPSTLRELANLLVDTGYRLVLNGKAPNNFLLQKNVRDNSTGARVWVNCGGYRYAEQFFACGSAAVFIATAASNCDGEQSDKLAAIAAQMTTNCDARMRAEKNGKYAESE
jgi:hypothetical protein